MKPFLIALIVIASQTTHSQSRYTYQHSDDHRIWYENGYSLAVSEHEKSSIAIEGYRDSKKQISFLIIVQNKNQLVNFFPEKIVITSIDKKLRHFTHPVYTHKEYLNKMQTQQTWNNIALAMNATLQSQDAGYSYSQTKTDISGSANSKSWVDKGIFTPINPPTLNTKTDFSATSNSSTISYDANLANEVKQQNINNAAQLSNANQQRINSSYESLIKPTTMVLNDVIKGYFVVKVSSSDKKAEVLQVEIPIGEEVHVFYMHK